MPSDPAQRPENIALPLPKGLAGAAVKMAVTKMIEHGWLQEVDASSSRGEPLWYETGDGHGNTLVVTDAGHAGHRDRAGGKADRGCHSRAFGGGTRTKAADPSARGRNRRC